MAHINLLPWREELRKQKQKEFFTFVGIAAVFTGVLVGGVHFYMAGLISAQNARNQFLQNEIVLVDKKISEIKDLEKQKEQLIARMQVIEQLQSNRPVVVHLFDELAKIIPEGLYLENVEQKGSRLTIKGKAQSNARVSAFMRSLEASKWFEKPALDVIATKKTANSKDREFTLQVSQVSMQGTGE